MNSWVKSFFEGYKDFFTVYKDCSCINDFILFFGILSLSIFIVPFTYIVCVLHDLGEFPFRRRDYEEEGS